MFRAMVSAGAIVWTSSGACAQSSPAIEAATIRANHSATAAWNHFDPERMIWTGAQLRILVEAFGLRPYEIMGAPHGSTPTGGM